jgi:hypothetical protein
LPKVICTLPNASLEISGVKFTVLADGTGIISEELAPAAAELFLSIPGYAIEPVPEPELPPAPKPSPVAPAPAAVVVPEPAPVPAPAPAPEKPARAKALKPAAPDAVPAAGATETPPAPEDATVF